MPPNETLTTGVEQDSELAWEQDFTLEWGPPTVSVLTLREAAKASRSIRRPFSSPEMSQPAMRKGIGATDAGGKGYPGPKPGGDDDFHVKNWP